MKYLCQIHFPEVKWLESNTDYSHLCSAEIFVQDYTSTLHTPSQHSSKWNSQAILLIWNLHMFCWPFIVRIQYSRTNKMHLLFSVYYQLTACTRFEHYLLIIRGHCIHNNLYILCILCQLAASPALIAASWHNTHKIYQLLYMQCPLMMSKQCSKHVEAVNS
jgi:hypothetical protein